MKKFLIAMLFLAFINCANAQNLSVSDNIVKEEEQQVQTIESYNNLCEQKVQENWQKTNIKHDDVTIKITFKTLQDGTVEDIEVQTPSKYEQNNQAAIKAIQDAAPFYSIPQELNAQYAEHTMFFPCRRYAQMKTF